MIGFKNKSARQGIGNYKTEEEAEINAFKILSSVNTKDDYESLIRGLSSYNRENLKRKIVEYQDFDIEDLYE